MANAVVEVVGLPTGLTLTATLYPLGSDTAAASGKTLTERTNGKGVYRATVTEGLSGWHRALVLSGTAVLAIFDVWMDDTATDHYAFDRDQSAAQASVATEARLSELDPGTPGKMAAEVDLVKTDAAAILVDTGTTLDGRIPAALVGGKIDANVGSKTVGLALTAQEKADVNAEVVDGLNVDTYAEPGQEAPAATNTLAKKIGYCFKFLRNRITQTSTTLKVYGDDAVTVDQKATVSDDATTYDRGEIGTGP